MKRKLPNSRLIIKKKNVTIDLKEGTGMSKHNQILTYIRGLKEGTKLSVRRLAQEMDVSEGTAYRAIKEAENKEFVKTFSRIGTIRVEKIEKKNIEKLTFDEVVSIVQGTVLGGNAGLHKTLGRFVIGAMTIDAMKKYIEPGNLLIVGNREEAFSLALESGCAVLITGGFGCGDEFTKLANEKALPIISSQYDTFMIATLISKAITDRMIKKEILLIEDLLTEAPNFLYDYQKICDFNELSQITGYRKFAVVDKNGNIIGVITAKDILSRSEEDIIAKVMTKKPITVSLKTSVAYAAHIIIWEKIEILPVVEGRRLVGVVNREDIVKSLQRVNSQPYTGETLDDMILKNFNEFQLDDKFLFKGRITPLMLSQIGTASWGAISLFMCTASITVLKKYKHLDAIMDSFAIYFMKPLQMDDELEMTVHIIDVGRYTNKIEVSICHENDLVAKAIISAKTVKK